MKHGKRTSFAFQHQLTSFSFQQQHHQHHTTTGGRNCQCSKRRTGACKWLGWCNCQGRWKNHSAGVQRAVLQERVEGFSRWGCHCDKCREDAVQTRVPCGRTCVAEYAQGESAVGLRGGRCGTGAMCEQFDQGG